MWRCETSGHSQFHIKHLAVVFAFAASGAEIRAATTTAPLAALAAAALLAARYYSFDPYYLPTLRRMSDSGIADPKLVYSLLAAATIVAALTLLRRRPGMLLSAPLLLLTAGAVWIAAAGH